VNRTSGPPRSDKDAGPPGSGCEDPPDLESELRRLERANLKLDAMLAEQRVRLAPWRALALAAIVLAALLWAASGVIALT